MSCDPRDLTGKTHRFFHRLDQSVRSDLSFGGRRSCDRLAELNHRVRSGDLVTPKDIHHSSPQHHLVGDGDASNRTTITDPSMIDEIVVHYRRVGRALRAADPADWASGLTMPQLRVLFLLGRSEPMPVGSVAEAMRISQPSATETVDRLVRAGLVTRTTCQNDRRVVRTALTPEGRDIVDRPWEARRAVLADALARGTADQQDEIARGLSTLVQLLEAEGELHSVPNGTKVTGSPTTRNVAE